MTAATRVLSAMLLAALLLAGCCPVYEEVYIAQPLPGTPVYVEPAPVVHTTVIARPYCPPPVVRPVYHTSVHVVRPACPRNSGRSRTVPFSGFQSSGCRPATRNVQVASIVSACRFATK